MVKISRKFYIGAVSLSVLMSVAACTSTTTPFSDWDRAVRVDKDLTTMFAGHSREVRTRMNIYAVMAGAIKNNYALRLARAESSLAEAKNGVASVDMLPSMSVNAGYGYRSNDYATLSDMLASNTKITDPQKTSDNSHLMANYQVAWNVLDFGLGYFRAKEEANKYFLSVEDKRKIQQNLLNEVRVAFWRAFAAQKYLPELDKALEDAVLYVDDLRTMQDEASSDDAQKEKLLDSQAELIKKIKELKQERDVLISAKEELASLIGLHPATEYALIGPEDGDYKVPAIKTKLDRLEWLALMSRPELRKNDYNEQIGKYRAKANMVSLLPNLNTTLAFNYDDDPYLYHKNWTSLAFDLGFNLVNFVKMAKNKGLNLEAENVAAIKREMLSLSVITEVNLAYGKYEAAKDNYEIDAQMADVYTDLSDIQASKNDEALAYYEKLKKLLDATIYNVRKSISYAELQSSVGDLFSAVGTSPLPDDVYTHSYGEISRALEHVLNKWEKGVFTPEDEKIVPPLPGIKPPVVINRMLPDLMVGEGEAFSYNIPRNVFDEAKLGNNVRYYASLFDDKPLPKWAFFDEAMLNVRGEAQTPDIGRYRIRITAENKNGESAWTSFYLIVTKGFGPRILVKGINEDRHAVVLDSCGDDPKKCNKPKQDKHFGLDVGKRVQVAPLD